MLPEYSPYYDKIPDDSQFNLKTMLNLMNLFGTDNLDEQQMSMLNNYIANGYTIYTIGINPNISNESQEVLKLLKILK